MKSYCVAQNISNSYLEFTVPDATIPLHFLFCAWGALNLSNLTEINYTCVNNQIVSLEESTFSSLNVTAVNIPNTFANDKYYPSVAVGSRYSAIYPTDAVQYDYNNCFNFSLSAAEAAQSVVLNISLEELTGQSFTMFVWNLTTGYVVGNKHGVVCDYIEPGNKSEECEDGEKTRYFSCLDLSSTCADGQDILKVGNTLCPNYRFTKETACELFDRLKTEYENNTVSPGVVETLIVDVIENRVSDWGVDVLRRVNQTIYAKLASSYDSRNKADGTRYSGLFPRCSGATCTGDRYNGTQDGEDLPLHDHLFRIYRLFDVIANAEFCG